MRPFQRHSKASTTLSLLFHRYHMWSNYFLIKQRKCYEVNPALQIKDVSSAKLSSEQGPLLPCLLTWLQALIFVWEPCISAIDSS